MALETFKNELANTHKDAVTAVSLFYQKPVSKIPP